MSGGQAGHLIQAIKCCKERKITALSNECRNIPLFACLDRDRACLSLKFCENFSSDYFRGSILKPTTCKIMSQFYSSKYLFKNCLSPLPFITKIVCNFSLIATKLIIVYKVLYFKLHRGSEQWTSVYQRQASWYGGQQPSLVVSRSKVWIPVLLSLFFSFFCRDKPKNPRQVRKLCPVKRGRLVHPLLSS